MVYRLHTQYRAFKKKGDVWMGPNILGFMHPVFSPVCIGRLGRGQCDGDTDGKQDV